MFGYGLFIQYIEVTCQENTIYRKGEGNKMIKINLGEFEQKKVRGKDRGDFTKGGKGGFRMK